MDLSNNATHPPPEPGDLDGTIYLLTFVYQYVFSWLVPLQYVVGCIGTVLCIIVLVRRHSTQKEVRPWFIALSVMDLYVMTIGLPLMYGNIVEMLVVLNSVQETSENQTEDSQDSDISRFDPRTWNKFNCYGINILHNYGMMASSWVQVGISLLRCLSTVVPLSSRSHINVTSSRRALCATLLVTLTVSVAKVMSTLKYKRWLDDGESHNKTTQTTPACSQKWDSPYYFYGTLVLRVFLPAVCLIVSTSVILYSLQKFKRAFHSEARRRTLQQRRISLILIGMNTSFLLFALPYEIHLIYGFVRREFLQRQDTRYQVVRKIVEKVFVLLMYTNNATNWIFYFVLGKQFREEMRRRLTCTKARVSKKVHYRFRHGGPNYLTNRGGLGTTGNHQRGNRCRATKVDEQMELKPLQDSPIGESRQAHSLDTVRCHANHRVCHINFKLSSV